MASSSQQSPFDLLLSRNLPDVTADIFLRLDTDDIGNCRRVCKRWRSFLDSQILGVPRLREALLTKRLMRLWNREEFSERKFQHRGLKWNELDIEAVSCKGRDVFLCTSSEVMAFRDLKLRKTFRLDEEEKLKHMKVGDRSIFLLLNSGRSCVVLRRCDLTLLKRRTRCQQAWDREQLHVVDGEILCLQVEPGRLTVNRVSDDDGEFVPVETVVDAVNAGNDFTKSTRMINSRFVYLAHPDGTADLFARTDVDASDFSPAAAAECMPAARVRYSDSAENFVKTGVLTDSYFGAVYHAANPAGGMDNRCNFAVFSAFDSRPLASERDVEVYGRVYISATSRHFVFSYADAWHSQHFVVNDFGGGKVVTQKVVLSDRPHPMRSMQILRDRLLILSFYRTASALNVFDLDRITTAAQRIPGADKMAADAEVSAESVGLEERVLKLPAGVIAFQNSFDACNSQKLVLYQDSGVLCQRLNFSSENLVFSLVPGERNDNEGKREVPASNKNYFQQHQDDGDSKPGVRQIPSLIRTGQLSMKKYKFRMM